MKVRNKIIAGFFTKYKFKRRYGKLYLKCLEREYAINKMTVNSIQVLDMHEAPSFGSVLCRSYLFSRIFGIFGMIAGSASAKRNNLYRIKITFANGECGIAEIDSNVYEMLIQELFELM